METTLKKENKAKGGKSQISFKSHSTRSTFHDEGTNDNEGETDWLNKSISDTLYKMFQEPLYNKRKTEGQDLPVLAKMINEETRRIFPSTDIAKNIEKSCFSLVLTDLNDDSKVMGHASFSDSPHDTNLVVGSKRWSRVSELSNSTPSNTLFLSLFLSTSKDSRELGLKETLAYTFQSCDAVEFIILECPSQAFRIQRYVFSNLVSQVSLKVKVEGESEKSIKKLIVYSKDLLLPKLGIRQGREVDLDDLVPLLTLDAREMTEYFNRSFLVDLISMSEKAKSTMVAEYDGYACGIIVVSSEIEYLTLQKNFHLEPFYGLCMKYVEDEKQCLDIRESRLFPKGNVSQEVMHDSYDLTEAEHVVRAERSIDIDKKASGESTKTSSITSLRSVKSKGSDASSIKSTTLITPSLHQYAKSSLLDTPNPNQLPLDDDGVSADDSHHVDIGSGLLTLTSTYDDSLLPHSVPTSKSINLASSSMSRKWVGEKLRMESHESLMFESRTQENLDELHKKLHAIVFGLRNEGKSIHSTVLDPETVRVIDEAEAFIHHCIHRYLHKTLIKEKLLPYSYSVEGDACLFNGMPNAICIELISMDKRFIARMRQLITGAFLAYPTRDYCIVTMPCTLPELPWLSYFARASYKSSSLYNRSLYVLHRSTFSDKLRMRKGTQDDCGKIHDLTETLLDGGKMNGDFKAAVCNSYLNPHGFMAFVLEVLTHPARPIVGLMIISPEQNAIGYQVNYELDKYVYVPDHDLEKSHAYVNHFVISPLYQAHSRLFTKEVMRMSGRDCFYHKIYPISADSKLNNHQSLLNNIEDWIPLCPRRRIEYSHLNLQNTHDELRQPPKEAQDFNFPYSLYLLSKKFTHEPKPTICTRVVIIGASLTMLSALDKILSYGTYYFKNITLISSNGLPGSLPPDGIRNKFFMKRNGPELSMKSEEEWVQRLPLRFSVEIVHGKVVRILRKVKTVVVSDDQIVPYDILVIGTGRKFVRPDSPEPEVVDERLNNFKKATTKDDTFTHKKTHKTPLPSNVFLINNDLDAAQALHYLRSFTPFQTNRQIIVHGACLESYSCIRALIELGVRPSRITLVTSGGNEMEWEAFHSYRDTPKLRHLMTVTFEQLGIKVLKNYTFRRWVLHKSTGLCQRVYYSTSESEGALSKISVSCFAYFSFAVRRVGDTMASAVSSAFLPYSNGIVINQKFETSDPNIYAAGPCTTYNKRLSAERYDHYNYSSYEVGQVLGEFLLKRLLPPSKLLPVTTPHPDTALLPPTLTSPLAHYSELPGGWYYLSVSPPSSSLSCCGEECKCANCECSSVIETGSIEAKEDREQKYIKIHFNAFHRVERIECISRKKFPPSTLTSLYGHHEAFLNRFYEKFEKGEIKDLYEHFCQPWVAALTHDRWISFRNEIQELIASYDIGENTHLPNFVRDYIDNLENDEVFKVNPNILRHVFDATNLRAAIEHRFLSFLKYNKSVLPMYARPDYVEDTYEERVQSPLYIPLHKNFGL